MFASTKQDNKQSVLQMISGNKHSNQIINLQHNNNQLNNNNNNSNHISTPNNDILLSINPDTIFNRRQLYNNNNNNQHQQQLSSSLSSLATNNNNNISTAPSSYQQQQPNHSISNNNTNSTSASSSYNHFYYKLVAKCGAKYYSIYDGQTEYKIGDVLKQNVQPKKGGGYYVYRTPEEAMSAKIPDESALFVAPRALLKCMCWGADTLEYGRTLCFSSLRPVQIFPLHFGTLNTKFSDRILTNIALEETRSRLPKFHGPQCVIGHNYRQREYLAELQTTLQSQEKIIQDIAREQLERLKKKHANAPTH